MTLAQVNAQFFAYRDDPHEDTPLTRARDWLNQTARLQHAAGNHIRDFSINFAGYNPHGRTWVATITYVVPEEGTPMPTVDYKRHERQRRNARLAYADAILSDAEARCAAADARTPLDPYALLTSLLDDEIERFKDTCESILEGCSDEDAPKRPVHEVFEEIRDWALRRPLRGDNAPPLPLPGQLRLPSADEIASSDPLTDGAGSATM